MKIEIEVISTNLIHPSSKTPNDLSKYKLSYLDQMNPPVLMPHTLFYKATDSLTNSEISNHLKESLSKTLSLYYPLAGRIVDNSYVKCNDEGITYVEARANCNLSDVINEPIPNELDKLLPRNLDDDTDHCVVIQTTFFNCGGLSIGVAVAHKLADAWSYFMFVNCWATISRGDANIQSPLFNGATLFPPRDLGGYNARNWMMSKKDIITKRFLFTASKINELRDKYTNTSRVTRIEALSAFIWTRLIHSTQSKNDPMKIFALVHVVNLRKRAVPPLSNDLFGNFHQPAIAFPYISHDEEKYTYGIIEKMREAINSVDGDYITKLREGNQLFNSINDAANKFLSGEMVSFNFTSLCRFPLLEADFGWGKPMWIGAFSGRFPNVVAFMDSFSGGGIEAWVNLRCEDMAKFEVDEELLTCATT